MVGRLFRWIWRLLFSGSPKALLVVKSIIAGGVGNTLVGYIFWKYPTTPHAIYIGTSVVSVVSIATFYVVSTAEEKRRTGRLEREVLTAQGKGDIYDRSVRHVRDYIFEQSRRPGHPLSGDRIAMDAIHGGLAAAQLLAEVDAPGTVRVSFLQPEDARHLRLTHWCYPDKNAPRRLDYLFELGDRDCKEVTTAGFAWYQWLTGGPSHEIIADVPKHLRETEGKPADRRFVRIHGDQLNKIRSIVCLAVFYIPPTMPNLAPIFHGILSIDSDEANAFTESNWPLIQKSIKSSLRVLSLSCFVNRVLPPMPGGTDVQAFG